MRRLLTIIVVAVTTFSSAQTKTPPATAAILIGMSREEVVRAFGEPSGYRMNGREYAQFPRDASGLVWDVYSRVARGHEYRVQVSYRGDTSVSRLHPTLRVEDVNFDSDGVLPVRTILGDLAEASLICQPSCEVDAESFPPELSKQQLVRVVAPSGKAMMTFSNWTDDRQSVPVTSLSSGATAVLLGKFSDHGRAEGILIIQQIGHWPD